jgi:hypothetical protein
MRIVRLIAALAMAASLAVLPVTAAAAMVHTAKAEMAVSGSGDDCPCCDRTASDGRPLVCCHLSALSVEGWAMHKPAPEHLVADAASALVAFVKRPDPPPPRS